MTIGTCEQGMLRSQHNDLPARMREQADIIETDARRHAQQIREAAARIEQHRGQS